MFQRIYDVYLKCLFSLGLVVLVGVPALGQNASSAALQGTVQDTSDASIPNAQVKLINTDEGTESHTTTNNSGIFNVPSVNPGHYTLEIERDGFATTQITGITLNVGDNRNILIHLKVGETTESVNVDGSGETLNTTDASVSTVVDRQFVENMPLNGRSFQNLIALTPGTVLTPTTTDDEGQFSVAGQRAGANYVTIDGVSANFASSSGIFQSQSANGGIPAFSAIGSTSSLVSIDALDQFRTETSTYSPEFGRESGAQMAIITRSGTNQFHGSVFDYFRNEVLDANDWFANDTGQPKPRERQNDFGGVLGGPIFRNKSFFFFSYEGLRVAQPFLIIADEPTLAARANAPANVKAIVDAMPIPNGPATGVDLAQFSASTANISHLDATSVRIDHTFTPKVSLFGRFNDSPSQQKNRGGGYTVVKQDVLTGTVGSAQQWAPAVTNDIRFNYSHSHAANDTVLDGFGGAVAPPDSALAASWQSLKTDWVYYGLSDARNSGIIEGPLADNSNRQLNVVDTIVVNKAAHSLKFGVDFRQLNPVQIPSRTGFAYAWLTTSSLVTGNAPDIAYVVQNPQNIAFRFHNFSAFAQDTWKASKRLTFTYGVRWDYNPPPAITSGTQPYVLSQTTNLATATFLPPGTPLWQADWKNFAPRIGGSYLLRQDSQRPTVARLGFGQLFDLGTNSAGALSNAEGYFPYSLITIYCLPGVEPACNNTLPYAGPEPAFSFSQPYPQMRAFDSHLKLPYSLEWSVAVEQSITPIQTFTISYIGSVGRRLLRDDLISNPNPMLSGLFLTRNSSYSSYNALQLQYQRRLTHGLQALVSYSWAHSLDLNSNDVTTGWNATTTIPTSLYNIRQDYGNSDFDIRQSFSTAVTYDLPQANNLGPWLRRPLAHWSLDALIQARTGTPFNILYQPNAPGAYLDESGTAINLRPNRVPGQPTYSNTPGIPGGRQLNLAAFAIPTVLGQGNEARNDLRGFDLVQTDLAVRRRFNFGERANLQFKAEAFNLINHPNFGNPANNLGVCALGVACTPLFGWGQSQAMLNQSMGSAGTSYATAFGSLYQVGGPRSLQLSLKLGF